MRARQQSLRSFKGNPSHPPRPQVVGPTGKVEPRSRLPEKEEPTVGSDSQNSFVSSVHGYINEYIRFADQKASFVFAAVAAMLGFLHGKGITKLWLKAIGTWGFADALAFVAVSGLVSGAIAAMLAVLPRGAGAPGLIYWASIARHKSAEDYAERVLAATPSELLSAKLRHSYEVACVCRKKFNAVNWAVHLGGIGLLASVLHLALF